MSPIRQHLLELFLLQSHQFAINPTIAKLEKLSFTMRDLHQCFLDEQATMRDLDQINTAKKLGNMLKATPKSEETFAKLKLRAREAAKNHPGGALGVFDDAINPKKTKP